MNPLDYVNVSSGIASLQNGTLIGVPYGPIFTSSSNTWHQPKIDLKTLIDLIKILKPDFSQELVLKMKDIVEDYNLTDDDKKNKINLLILEN